MRGRWIGVLVAMEVLLSVMIIHRVAYTEIDWDAYMSEVAGVFRDGELDYRNLSGSTGPLVYPAGFVYLYGVLRWFTTAGTDIRVAQYWFAFFYVATVVTVLFILRKCNAPPVVLVATCLSRRAHSIFMLRLFNDGPSMLLFYISLLLLVQFLSSSSSSSSAAAASSPLKGSARARISEKLLLASTLCFSLAVSIKMNVLLFAPAYLWVWFLYGGWPCITRHSFLVFASQIALGAPFLATYPASYLAKAFEFSRVFQFKWSVNWAFMHPAAFASSSFALFLLGAHIFMLAIFYYRRFQVTPAKNFFLPFSAFAPAAMSMPRSTDGVERRLCSPYHEALRDPRYICAVFFTVNIIGVVCARTLHYQFYAWYVHSIPFLLWVSRGGIWWEKVLTGLLIEVVWNLYPPSPIASAVLLSLHFRIVFGMFWSGVWDPELYAAKSTQRRRPIHKPDPRKSL
eukprot:ANDGO_08062.mRNA.1 putative Dol-P-Man:Man(5)GlcNAc(2)-PP-Dol alpha-1